MGVQPEVVAGEASADVPDKANGFADDQNISTPAVVEVSASGMKPCEQLPRSGAKTFEETGAARQVEPVITDAASPECQDPASGGVDAGMGAGADETPEAAMQSQEPADVDDTAPVQEALPDAPCTAGADS